MSPAQNPPPGINIAKTPSWILFSLLLLPSAGCLDPAPRTGADPAHGSQWPFAQGTVDGRRASSDAAVNLATLGQVWSTSTRGAVTGTPTVVDGRVYVGTWKGIVHSLSSKDGSTVWTKDLGAQVDASVTLEGGLALVGDAAGRLHALDVSTGTEVWTRVVDGHLHAHLYATPLVVPARPGRAAFIVQGVASDQESLSIHGDAPVDFRGHVAAFRLDGTPLWDTFLVPEGSTGAPVWGTPVYDAGTDRVVFGTGNAYTAPAGELTDSIVALDAADGTIAWHLQATTGDVFTQGRPMNPDHDFGATPTLFPLGGRTVVGIGQKSSVFWAVDVVKGTRVWTAGRPASGEGIIGDAALAGAVLVVPYATLGQLVALDVADGSVRWQKDMAGRAYADPVAVPGGVIAADTGGGLHGLDVTSGEQVWNGTVGEGGAVFGGLSIAEGKLFVPVVRGGFRGDAGLVIAFASGGGRASATASSASADGRVAMRGFQFEPREIHVGVGQDVVWVNEDPTLHTVTSVDDGFDLSVAEGKSTHFTFAEPGTFAYYCKPHSTKGSDGTWTGMTGTVVVR